MWDEDVDKAIDEVARELPADGSANFKADVLHRIENRAVPRRSLRWYLAVGAASIVIATVALGIFRWRQQRGSQQAVAIQQAQPLAVRSLVWVDRQGREEPLGLPLRAYMSVSLSPDGGRLAVDIEGDGASDVWVANLTRATLSRFSFDPATDASPVWSPDGRYIVYTSERAGVANLFGQPSDGSGAAERLTTSSNRQRPVSFSPDGQSVVFEEEIRGQSADLGLLRLSQPMRVEVLIRTPFDETGASVSPDGRWLAFRSNAAGRNEIYVRPFASGPGLWQVSDRGGDAVRWSRDGKEIFYLNSGKLMAVSVTTEPSFTLPLPTELFEGPYIASFDVAVGAQRFLMIKND